VAVAALLATARPCDAYELRIEGIEGQQRDNILAHLGTLEPRVLENPKRLEARVAETVDNALQPYGYYAALTQAQFEDDRLTITVNRGPPIIWAPPALMLHGDGHAQPELVYLLEHHPFLRDQPALHEDYDRFREQLLRELLRLGYLDAHFTERQLEVDVRHGVAVARLSVETGPRYTYGDIRFIGSRIDLPLLEATLPFESGQAFDNESILQLDRHLRNTDYFDSASIQIEKRPEAVVDINALLSDYDHSRYEVGAGFSTDADIRIRLNRRTPLLNEHGHSLNLESELSEQYQTLEALYRIPRSSPLDDVFEMTGGIRNRDIQDTKSVKATLGAFHLRRSETSWNIAYGASFEAENYQIGNEDETHVVYLLPGTMVSYKRIQPGVDPLSGRTYWLSADFSSKNIGSDTDFFRLRGGAKWLTNVGNNNTTLLLRAEVGAIINDEFNAVPASMRFYAGGDNSLRGYDYESLSPKNASGNIIGGEYLTVGSIEVTHRVRTHWRIAAFVDAGSAFSSADDPFYQSAGLGLRWLSPVGQVRFDIAVPVADPDNKGIQLHISMGPPI